MTRTGAPRGNPPPALYWLRSTSSVTTSDTPAPSSSLFKSNLMEPPPIAVTKREKGQNGPLPHSVMNIIIVFWRPFVKGNPAQFGALFSGIFMPLYFPAGMAFPRVFFRPRRQRSRLMPMPKAPMMVPTPRVPPKKKPATPQVQSMAMRTGP